MRVQSLVEIGARTATGDEKQWCFCLYACVFATLDVQDRGPDVQQRKLNIMSAFLDQFQCGFHCFFSDRNELSNCLQRFQLHYYTVSKKRFHL